MEKLKVRYTVETVNDFISKCSKDNKNNFKILYTNSNYMKVNGNNQLDDDAWWYSYDVRNYRCSSFWLITVYSDAKYTDFKWNAIIDVRASKTNSSGQDVSDYLTLYNWTLGTTAPKNKYTILKRNPDEPQFYVTKSPQNYVYKMCRSQINSFTRYVFNFFVNNDPNNKNIYIDFLKDLCTQSGKCLIDDSNCTKYIEYEMIFCHTGITSVVSSSSITIYKDTAFVRSPRDMTIYRSHLTRSICREYKQFRPYIIDLDSNNDNLDWKCKLFAISYMVDDKVFIVCYELKFSTMIIESMRTYRCNGDEVELVSNVLMEKDFNVTYMNGTLETDAGVNVTSSKISLDIDITYNKDREPKYMLEYENLWYNYVGERPYDVEINYIILFR